jgi:DNA-binding NarL/FixJ family response regulator
MEKTHRHVPNHYLLHCSHHGEPEVRAAMAEGMTNKSIALFRLDFSLHTVKFHVESVFRKMGAHT